MLTRKDEIILGMLKENSKLSTREISEKTSIPITTVHNRVKKLEKDGVIKGYTAVVDNKKVGRGIQAFIQITVTYTSPTGRHISQEELAKRIYQMPEVEECYILTGASDIIIKISVADVDALNDFVINKLRDVEGVQSTLTAIVLKDVSALAKKTHLYV